MPVSARKEEQQIKLCDFLFGLPFAVSVQTSSTFSSSKLPEAIQAKHG